MSDSVYRERARLSAYLAAVYPSHISPSDPDEPDWQVLIVETPTGQMSWHISAEDMDLFDHVPASYGADWERPWDGHSTEEKYERLEALVEMDRI